MLPKGDGQISGHVPVPDNWSISYYYQQSGRQSSDLDVALSLRQQLRISRDIDFMAGSVINLMSTIRCDTHKQ
jgi:hypothetical protein